MILSPTIPPTRLKGHNLSHIHVGEGTDEGLIEEPCKILCAIMVN